MTAVVDASVIVDLLTAPPEVRAVLGERLLGDGVRMQAPELLDLEVLNVVRRRLAQRELSPEGADAAVLALGRLSITRHRHHRLVARAWALRENVTPYDGAYVALAELLDAPLVTLDGRLARALLRGVRFELIEP